MSAASGGAAGTFCALVARDLRLALRHGADTLGALLFFLLAGSLFPLALGPSPELLRRMAPGIVWVCALLAALLPLDRLFGAELEDGALDQLMLCGLPAAALASAKMAAHWLTTGLPLLGARRGGVLLPLLVLPLATPALIFGASAVDAVQSGSPFTPHLLLLAAFLAGALPLCPLAAGAGLRAAVE